MEPMGREFQGVVKSQGPGYLAQAVLARSRD